MEQSAMLRIYHLGGDGGDGVARKDGWLTELLLRVGRKQHDTIVFLEAGNKVIKQFVLVFISTCIQPCV